MKSPNLIIHLLSFTSWGFTIAKSTCAASSRLALLVFSFIRNVLPLPHFESLPRLFDPATSSLLWDCWLSHFIYTGLIIHRYTFTHPKQPCRLPDFTQTLRTNNKISLSIPISHWSSRGRQQQNCRTLESSAKEQTLMPNFLHMYPIQCHSFTVAYLGLFNNPVTIHRLISWTCQ